jgi:hypothetical protein
MSDRIVWVHGDYLNPHQPALRDHPQAPAVFVWDDALLHRRQINLKRIVFLYECLLDLPVAIRRGRPVAEITAFAREHRAATVVTMHSVSPGFARICRALRANGLQVEVIDPEPFVELPDEPDLRRFSRYWRAAQKHL